MFINLILLKEKFRKIYQTKKRKSICNQSGRCDNLKLTKPGAHYQERDCKVHPAISTVTKVSIFGSRFPTKSSYHDDCHKSEKYGGQTIGTVHDLLE